MKPIVIDEEHCHEALQTNREQSIYLTKKKFSEVWDDHIARASLYGIATNRYSQLYQRVCEELGFENV